MEGVPIRAARRGDIPSLLLLWEQMLKENAAADPRLEPHPRAREHMAAQFQAWLSDAQRIIVVAEEGGRLVIGYAAGAIVPGNGWQAPTTLGEITDCYVARPRRRQGIARRLVGRVIDQLFEKGVDTCRLQVGVHNEGSRAFWASMGWKPHEVVYERPV
ncbi:MAG: GNAT family N-acetyltransferase [Planctomycetota bacterium]|nr:GNAT family N-acetyltransferase [Planctomycetota bacterium]